MHCERARAKKRDVQAVKNPADQQQLFREALEWEARHAKDKAEPPKRERELARQLAEAEALASGKAPSPDVAQLSG